MPSIKKTLAKNIVPLLKICFFVGLLAVQVTFFLEERKLAQKSDALVAHTHKVIDSIENLHAKIKDTEIGQHSYLVIGDKKLLEPYHIASGKNNSPSSPHLGNVDNRPIDDLLGDLQKLTHDNPVQQKAVQELSALVAKKLEITDQIIDLDQQGKKEEALELIQKNLDEGTIKNIHNIIYKMRHHEKALLRDRMNHSNTLDESYDYYIVITGALLYTALLMTIVVLIRKNMRIYRTERILHAKDMHFHAAAEGGLDAFLLFQFAYDDKGSIKDIVLEYLNPVAQSMLGKTLDETKGQKIEQVLAQQDSSSSAIRKLYFDILTTHKSQQNEYCAVSGPSAGEFFQQQVVLLSNGLAISCRNITERKQIDKMKNEFVSTVSHELRTPLTSIRGSLGLITGGLAGALSDEAKNLLAIAYNNCERLVRLINDILDIEKIESGRMVFEYHNYTVRTLLEQAIAANQSYADKYDVRLTLDVRHDNNKDPLTIYIDQDRFTQVVTNLLSNAIKFSPAGGTVVVGYKKDGDSSVCITVEDKGTGIPENFRNIIFEKFAQADSSDDRQKGGTGLGLSIVKLIIDQMKGTIRFDSTEGKGTTFYITFPVAHVGDVILAEHHDPVPYQKAKPRLLVCEDEKDIANFLMLIFDKAGFTVDIAYDATGTLELLNNNHYDALILDLVLPDRHGLSLIQELRADPRFVDLPILVVSAKAEEGKIEMKDASVGIMDWLSKPIDMNRLTAIINKLPSLHTKPRVLHVEDDPDIAHILRIAMEDQAEIILANTIAYARELLEKDTFDLVILDSGLPDGTGTDLLPLTDADSSHPVPVILFTAADIPQDVSTKVASALVKSRTSEAKLIETIQHLIHHNDTTKNGLNHV